MPMARWGKRSIGAVIAGFAAIILADFIAPPPLEKARAVSAIVVDNDRQWLHAFAGDEGRWRFAASFEEIDPSFIDKLIAIEDKRFFHHPGIDPAAILRAAIDWARTGQIRSGASTITMQTARLLEPRPRTLPSKAIEMLRALQIERRLTKKEILEIYLTLAPYGGNIEGVRAASRLYFGKDPVALNDAEQALLIALPQAPEARRPDRRPVAATAARQEILEKLVRLERLNADRADEAAQVPVPAARQPMPQLAYHTAHRLANYTWPGFTQTTIDLAMQERASAALRAHLDGVRDGASGAVLIVENETGAVRAAVGSSGLDAPGGWINLNFAVRSPGSTLKPFIYAQAFEDGRVGPGTLIDDMPRSFGGYTPENFDRTFRGEVRVATALQHSLNIPAVAALELVGAERFANKLKNAGIALRTPRKAEKGAGLALALGGTGVRGVDLATLYLALANHGEMTPVKWTHAELAGDEKTYRFMSEDNARRVSAILRASPSLAGRAPSVLSERASPIAFKTGTSYGYRDAWSAGHGAGHTIVVWIGRADGGSRPGQTGRKAAAPLLFSLFDLVQETYRDGDEAGDNALEPVGDPLVVSRGVDDAPGPQIVFPQNGAELYASQPMRGFALAARGGGEHTWYANGEVIERSATSARTIWHPQRPGFYTITVVDGAGRSTVSKIRLVGAS